MTRLLALMGIATVVVACGGAVHVGTTDNSAGAGQGTGGATNGGSGTVGGSGIGGSQGGSGGDVCVQTQDSATIEISLSGTSADSSESKRDVDMLASGVVTSVQSDGFTLETCSPNEQCYSNTVAVTIGAAGLDLTNVINVGVLAEAHLVRQCPWGCTSDIVVKSLDTWGDMTNANPAMSGIYVAADDGGGSPDGVPYQVEQVQLPCPGGYTGNCGDSPGLYLQRFTNPSTSEAVDIHMGEARWLRSGNGWLLLRNLRSYVTGYCDDYWNWSHWAANGTPAI